MYVNNNSFQRETINRLIVDTIKQMAENIPVKIDKVNDDLTVDCSSLVDKRLFKNITVYKQPNSMINIDVNNNKDFKYGLLIGTKYYFNELYTDQNKINSTLMADGTNFGILLPLFNESILNKYKDNKDFDISLFDKENSNIIHIDKDNISITTNNNKNSIELSKDDIKLTSNNEANSINLTNDKIILGGTEIALNSKQPMDIKTETATLKDILTELTNALLLSATGTGNQGAPIIPNPQLQLKMTEIINKLNMLLK